MTPDQLAFAQTLLTAARLRATGKCDDSDIRAFVVECAKLGVMCPN